MDPLAAAPAADTPAAAPAAAAESAMTANPELVERIARRGQNYLVKQACCGELARAMRGAMAAST